VALTCDHDECDRAQGDEARCNVPKRVAPPAEECRWRGWLPDRRFSRRCRQRRGSSSDRAECRGRGRARRGELLPLQTCAGCRRGRSRGARLGGSRRPLRVSPRGGRRQHGPFLSGFARRWLHCRRRGARDLRVQQQHIIAPAHCFASGLNTKADGWLGDGVLCRHDQPESRRWAFKTDPCRHCWRRPVARRHDSEAAGLQQFARRGRDRNHRA
jgi:hypothetical protein